MSGEDVEIHVHAGGLHGTLIYLPGLHGDCTLIPGFRALAVDGFRFVEFVYPRTMQWSLADYARHVLSALERNGIRSGWLIGESFGSQVVWEMLRMSGTKRIFDPTGVVLAGGFVKYPVPPLVDLGIWLASRMSRRVMKGLLKLFEIYARFRFRRSPETFASIGGFIDRRTDEDLRAMIHRMRLIRGNDPRDIARSVRLPVFLLSGLIDPIVCQPAVRFWLWRHCPGFRGAHTIAPADHTLLATEPGMAFDRIVHWIDQEGSSPEAIM